MTITTEILLTAAAHKVSCNTAATLIEEASGNTLEIPLSAVAVAVRALEAAWTTEPAGGYWDVCLKAAKGVA